MKVGIYARVLTQEQQTLPFQIKDLREFAKRRKWKIEIEISDVASGAKTRPTMDNKLTAEIKKRGIPPLYAQENAADPTIYLELSLFQFPWRWYVSECEIEDGGDVLFSDS